MARRTKEELIALVEKPKTLKRLKLERDLIESEPVNNFQCSRPQDIIKIEKAIRDFEKLLVDEDGKLLWKMADNTYAKVSKADMEAIDPLQVVKVSKAYAAEAQAIALAANATTLEELNSISVKTIYNSLI